MTDEPVELPVDRSPILRVTTRINDANPSGDIFGGWLMSQIDIAGAIVAAERAKGPVVTVAVKDLQFIKPLYVHDLVSFYADVVRVGSTSLTVYIEVFAQRQRQYTYEAVKVSDATLVYVAVTEPGKPRKIT
jgi:acyl-CoA thioesterase YciA